MRKPAPDLSRRRAIQGSEEMQQCALSGSRLADDRNHLAFRNVQGEIAEEFEIWHTRSY
jgi:hypothetical protein